MHRIELNRMEGRPIEGRQIERQRPPARWTRCVVYTMPAAPGRRDDADTPYPLTRIVALRQARGGTLTAA
ncbi:MAG: hypothetical protein R2834_21060 [Rhodothermales bacterium]